GPRACPHLRTHLPRRGRCRWPRRSPRRTFLEAPACARPSPARSGASNSAGPMNRKTTADECAPAAAGRRVRWRIAVRSAQMLRAGGSDCVPAFSFGAERATVEAELGRPLEAVYAAFDPEPVAAASVA